MRGVKRNRGWGWRGGGGARMAGATSGAAISGDWLRRSATCCRRWKRGVWRLKRLGAGGWQITKSAV